MAPKAGQLISPGARTWLVRTSLGPDDPRSIAGRNTAGSYSGIIDQRQMDHAREILEKLTARDFDALIGVAESVWLDAKDRPYVFDTTKQRLELAKDVSALANAVGGIIVLGFDTARDPLTAGERISEVRPFPVNMVDPDRYRKIVHEYVYPPLDIAVTVFEAADGKGVAAIVVEGAASKPYIVGKMMDETGQSIGAHFGFFERKQDVIPPVSVARIQQQLAAGQQWTSIDQRLQAIESNISSWGKKGPPVMSTGITEKIRSERLKAARIAVERDDAPLVYFMASAEGECDFPTLFRSRAERVVRLIEKPPQLREQGFEIWAGDTSAILLGRMRRNMLAGHRLIELWKDGLFIFIAPGDEDFLGWRMGGGDRPIHIRNFVLAESILAFCWLMKFIFEEADPKPPVLRLTVGFDNLTRPSGAATLSTAPEGRMTFLGNTRSAPGPQLEVYQLADLADYDPEHLCFLLMADIYHWFGYDSMSVPYVDQSGPKAKLSAVAIIGSPLPDTVATPDYF